MTVLVPQRRILKPRLSIPRLNFRRLGDPSFNRLGVRGQPWGFSSLSQESAEAGIVCAVTRFAARTGSIGSQDITTPDLGGLTPKAVLLYASRAVTDATAAAHAHSSIGAATAADQEWCIMATDEDAQATTDTRTQAMSDACIRITAGGSGTAIAQADFTAFIADGMTLNWSVVDAAFLITAVFFAGSSLNARAGTEALGDIVDNAVDITDPGFEPDLVIAAVSNGDAMGAGGNGVDFSVGFCHNDGVGGVTQRASAWGARHNQAAGVNSVTLDTSSVLIPTVNGASGDWRGVFGSFDSSGWTVTTADAGANNSDMGYLALNFGGVNSWVGTTQTPTATGNHAETGPGFTPQLVLRLLTGLNEIGRHTATADDNAAWGFSAMDGDEAYSASIASLDGAATTDTQSLNDNVSVELPDSDGTAKQTATFVSFDGTGWTDNWTAVDAVDDLFHFALAIGS